jgi:molybdenum cofactor synthesis domain-containing protein
MVVHQEIGPVLAIRAEILTLGRELLIGKTLNTNASWIASQLTSLGISVERIVVAPDSVAQISVAIADSLQRHPDILVITGGLGSTYDDLTTDGLASALRIPKEINRAAMEQVEERYRPLGLEMTPSRQKMAIMPAGSTPIPNETGSAPGLFIESLGTMIFCLPGVPGEMKGMFGSGVLKILKGRAGAASFLEESLVVEGMPESSLAPIIEEWMPSSRGVYLKSHPSGGEGKPTLLVHLSITGRDRARMARDMKAAMKAFEAMVESHGGMIARG